MINEQVRWQGHTDWLNRWLAESSSFVQTITPGVGYRRARARRPIVTSASSTSERPRLQTIIRLRVCFVV